MSTAFSQSARPVPEAPKLKVALWAIRRFMETDPIETLQFLHKLGIEEVELAGFYDWAPTEMAGHLAEHHLKTCSLHGPSLIRERSVSAYIDWAKPKLDLFQTSTFCLESIPEFFGDVSVDTLPNVYDELARTLIGIAEGLISSDIRVSYHCYDHDFISVDGKPLLARFLRLDRPPNLGLQLDTYWYARSMIAPDEVAAWPIEIHSFHLNKRDEDGKCSVIDGETKGWCEAYMKPLMHLGSAIDWILENDDDQALYPNEGSVAKTLVEQCFLSWGSAWQKLAQQDKFASADK